MNSEQITRNRYQNKSINIFSLFIIICYLLSVPCSCDYGNLGGADKTDTYLSGSAVFEERLNFLSGVWYSHYAGIGRLDGYRIRKWSDITAADKTKLQSLFPALNIDNPKTYSTQDTPKNDDYILLYDDTVYGQQDDDSACTDGNWGFAYAGIVRAINIFNDNKNRGAVIIEYFEEADPVWLWDSGSYANQELAPGEKPFFGIFFRVLEQDVVQMANSVNLANLYSGTSYHTEQKTLQEAIDYNCVVNEAEFISWGVVIPQQRVK
ncbi:MAG: hypothetical protein FWB86_11635 [Treponema sp.]|nr:hypothetical protein [Treponema sp.]MCL2252159.1 hypothetical protein [Treponema sp.]